MNQTTSFKAAALQVASERQAYTSEAHEVMKSLYAEMLSNGFRLSRGEGQFCYEFFKPSPEDDWMLRIGRSISHLFGCGYRLWLDEQTPSKIHVSYKPVGSPVQKFEFACPSECFVWLARHFS